MPEKLDTKLLAWGADAMDPNAIEQAKRTARLPFVHQHVALMPDAHWGMGSTIGSVIPTQGAIIPAAVGVDIGCGMIAVETTARAEHLPDDLAALHSLISERVPAGLAQGHQRASGAAERWYGEHPLPDQDRPKWTGKDADKIVTQFGSLGSGNHFAEVCLDEREVVWLVLHSGSRGIGHGLAQRHIETAKKLAKRWFIPLEDPDLAYLVQGTPEFGAYIRDMTWAQEYAAGNRERMMDEVVRSLIEVTSDETSEVRRINCHHNYTQVEHHHGQNLWITRKGAIKAGVGDEGVIPGSMGTRSYIVRGKGNPASFTSCSHGAGRRMSRGVARKTFTEADLAETMGDREWNSADAKTLLDEHPGAYKDIDTVMAAQADLVEIEHTLRQVLNYKGT